MSAAGIKWFLKLFAVIACNLLILTASNEASSYKVLVQKLSDKIDNDWKSIPIAVLPFEEGASAKGSSIANRVTEGFLEALADEGYTLVERSKLEVVLKELELQQSGLFEQSSLKKMGTGLGAEAVIIGNVAKVSEEEIRVSVRMVDTTTYQVLAIASELLKTKKGKIISARGPKLFIDLLFGIKPIIQSTWVKRYEETMPNTDTFFGGEDIYHVSETHTGEIKYNDNYGGALRLLLMPGAFEGFKIPDIFVLGLTFGYDEHKSIAGTLSRETNKELYSRAFSSANPGRITSRDQVSFETKDQSFNIFSVKTLFALKVNLFSELSFLYLGFGFSLNFSDWKNKLDNEDNTIVGPGVFATVGLRIALLRRVGLIAEGSIFPRHINLGYIHRNQGSKQTNSELNYRGYQLYGGLSFLLF